MTKLIEINNNNLAKLLEDFVDSGVKIVDDLNLFKDDELFASIPYGKIVNYVTKKIIQISDPNEALKKAVALAVAYNLLIAIKKSNNILIDEKTFYNNLKTAKEELKKIQTNVSEFDLESFFDNELVNIYTGKIDSILKNQLNEFQKTKIRQHRVDYLKIDFLRILEANTLVYEKLNNVFKNKSYEELIKFNRMNKYQQGLKNLFNDIVLNDQAGLTLADIYIEPMFKVHAYCINRDSEFSKREYRNQSFHKISDKSVHSFIYDNLSKVYTDKTLFNINSNLYFILGYPGQGKSSFCKKVMFDIYSKSTTIHNNIVFIKIRNIVDTLSLINNPLETLYEHWLLEYDIDKRDFSKNDFQEFILILDGLDELFMKENLPQKAIDEFCKALVRETEIKQNLKIIITSRYGYINLDLLKKTHALIIQLDEFSELQQLDWLTKFTAFHPETNLSKEKIRDYNNHNIYKPIKELITQPILLHLIATLNQEVTTEMNRAMIYDRLFTELISRSWAKEGQIDNLKGLEEEDLRDFIRDIAYSIFRSGREYIHKSLLLKLPATKSFIDKLENKDNIQDVLKNIMIAFYFQETKKEKGDFIEEERNDYAIEFLHKSLQEYLVAEKLWESLQEFINKDSRKGKYFIDSASVGLELLNNLFSEILIPTEIINNLNEIIDNSELYVREELSERFDVFFSEWLEFGLVNKFTWKEESFRAKESAIYFNFFQVLTNLIDGKNYFTKDVDISVLSNKNVRINFKDQVFTGSYAGKDTLNTELDEIETDIYNSHFQIFDVRLNEKKAYSFSFNSVGLRNIKFFQIHSYAIGVFHNSFLSNCEFFSVKTSPRRFLDKIDLKFTQCIIRFTSFSEGHYEIENSKFYYCTFHRINDHSFINCSFEGCIFYIKDDTDKEILKSSKLLNCAEITLKSKTEDDEEDIINNDDIQII